MEPYEAGVILPICLAFAVHHQNSCVLMSAVM